ncbi:hypothetical protein MSAR_02010 [Mycolicibacterium sarraceniae]|uniref:Uncharacterized protein n=1 Tax=Mycolicibacterium sarraceniae TaxID=1534348 RepID=A0A7I7SM30_9MYCO|nr:hypothetical protein MSAR_02010 [Mycolicibacterium sarraceniae]
MWPLRGRSVNALWERSATLSSGRAGPDRLSYRHLSGSWVNVRVVAVRRAALFPAMPALSIFVGDPAG